MERQGESGTLSPGQLNQLLRAYSEASRREPQNLELQCKLAEVLRLLDRKDEAVALYASVAWAYGQMGNLAQAITFCKVILELNPQHQETQQMLAGLYASQRIRHQKQAVPVLQVDGRWVADPARTDEPSAEEPPDVMTSSEACLDPPRGDGEVTRREPLSLLYAGHMMATTEPPLPRADSCPGATTAGYVTPTGTAVAQRVDTRRYSRQTLEYLTVRAKATNDADDAAALDPGVVSSVLRLQQRPLPLAQQTLQARSYVSIQREVFEAAGKLHPDGAASNGGPAPTMDDSAVRDAVNAAARLERETLCPLPQEPFPLFSDLDGPAFLAVVEKLQRRVCSAGTTVFEEGDPGDSLFLVSSGALAVLKRDDKGSLVELSRLMPGAFFGEFALLTDRRRHASVRCVEDSELLELRREVLFELVEQHPSIAWTLRTFYQQRLMATVLATSPLFQAIVDAEERRAVLSRFTVKRIMNGELIIEEGQPSPGFFVLLIGEVAVSCRGDDGSEVLLGKLSEGDYFGEFSLLTGETAAATVRATTIAEVLALSARDFYDLASAHPEIWAEVHEEAERRQRANAERLGHLSAADISNAGGLPYLI